jgi:hypothetical protein
LKQDYKRIGLIIVTCVTGVIILAGYFITIPAISGIRSYLINLASILASILILIGIINLTIVHTKKMISREQGAWLSLIFLITMIMTLIIGLVYGPTSKWSLWIINHVQIPVETSLVSLLVIILILGLIRMLYRKQTSFALIFLLTTIIILLGSITIPWIDISVLVSFQDWITNIPVLGGMRGILIGVVLGIVATGLRVLIGADRPYED